MASAYRVLSFIIYDYYVEERMASVLSASRGLRLEINKKLQRASAGAGKVYYDKVY